jgi:6-phospho-3-hexuloisomerase
MDAQSTHQHRPWLAVGRELTELLDRVDPAQFAAFAREAEPANFRWFFTGQGRSGLSAQMAAMRFMHLGRESHVLGEATAPSVRAGDRLVIVSGSGQTPVSINYARIATSEGATVLLVTYSPGSPLGEIADVTLVAPVLHSDQLMGNLFEQSALILLDAVAIHIAEVDPAAKAGMSHLHTNMQ